MTKAKFIPLLTKATGLCNTKDPVRLTYDLKTGESQLAQAVNVNVERDGRISRVTGYTLKRAEASHSAWSDNDTCLFVSGTYLYALSADYSRTLVRTGLTPGAWMSYVKVGTRVYYTNGHELGRVEGLQDATWGASTVTRPDDNKTYSDPPVGHLVANAFGRMLIAKDNFIFASEPALYGNFNLAKFRAEPFRITSMWAVPGGLFVGTEKSLVFYRGEAWEKLQREVKALHGVLVGSGAWAQPEALKLSGGRVVVFSTTAGICVGAAAGEVRNLTEDILVLPVSARAAAAVIDHRYVVHISP